MKPIVYVHRLGRTPYKKALDIQLVLFEKLKSHVSTASTTTPVFANRSLKDERYSASTSSEFPCAHSQSTSCCDARNSLLLLEHCPVYTIGIRSQTYGLDYVLKLQRILEESNLHADFVPTNRGGLITFHGPGQLVAYPIINLADFKHSVPNKSIKAYVKNLEDTIIETLDTVGLKGAHTVSEYPGVWLGGGDRKIAFIGISCKRHVTMHGVSINCDCDLSWFDHIVSCGITNKAITSVRRELMLGAPSKLEDSNDTGCPIYSVKNVADAFCSSFARRFACDLRDR